MIQIGVKSSIDQAIAKLAVFDENQLPFAVSKALNDTAFKAQTAVRAAMPSEFTIRRDWIVKGVLVIKSTKQNLLATIYSRDDFMARQEYGGEKVPYAGGHAIAVPLRSAFPIGAVIPDNMRPKNLVNTLTGKGGVTTGVVTLHNGKRYIAQLIPGAARGSRLQFLYALLSSVHVLPRFNLAAITYKVVRARFMANLAKSLELAIATAKPK